MRCVLDCISTSSVGFLFLPRELASLRQCWFPRALLFTVYIVHSLHVCVVNHPFCSSSLLCLLFLFPFVNLWPVCLRLSACVCFSYLVHLSVPNSPLTRLDYVCSFHGLCYSCLSQVVVLAHVLVDESNSGYQGWSNLQVRSLNGVPIRNLRHLKETVEGECARGEEYLRFELDDHRLVVISRQQAEDYRRTGGRRHQISKLSSDDL